MFKTRVTQMLGIEHPLIAGTMLHLSRAEFVAAVANAGAFGSIASFTFETKKAFREEIRKAKSLTDKPFGVNISLFPTLRPVSMEEYIDTALEEGIKVIETSGMMSPATYVELIKKGGALLMHKCARVSNAQTAERVGADIVEIVGFECGGHPGGEEVTTLVLLPRVVDALKIPVVGGGGFGDARGFAACLALGAEGVLMGTSFMATKECPVHENFKKAFIEATETATMLVERSIGNPVRVIRNEAAEKVLEMEQKGATLEDLIPLITGERARKVIASGDIQGGIMACGQVVGLIHDVPMVKELVDSIINGAKEIIGRLSHPA